MQLCFKHFMSTASVCAECNQCIDFERYIDILTNKIYAVRKIKGECTDHFLPGHCPLILKTFPFTVKHNAMKCKTQNICETTIKKSIWKILSNSYSTLCLIFYRFFCEW